MGDEGGHKVLTFDLVSPYTLFHLGTKKIEDACCLDIEDLQLCVVEMLCACEPPVNLSAQVVFTQNGLKCHCLKAGLFDPNFSLE